MASGKSVLFRQGDQVNDDLGVTIGLKDRALAFETGSNRPSIHQISVVCHSNGALVRLNEDGLGIQQSGVPRCRIPGMANGKSATQRRQNLLREDVRNRAHGFMGARGKAIRRDDAGGLLSAMLQRVQSEVGELFGFWVREDRYHSAFIVKFVRDMHFARFPF